MKKILFLLIAAALASPAAMAHQAGDFLVRGGLATVSPQTSDEMLDIDSDTQLGLTFTYMITENWGVELLAATPFSHSVYLQDLPGAGEVAKVNHLPPTLMAQYYFGDASSKVRPYIGAGINYTTFFNEEGRGVLENADVNAESSWGLAGQVGLDLTINERWFANASLWVIDIDSDVNISSGNGAVNGTINTSIDPLVFMFGVGYRF